METREEIMESEAMRDQPLVSFDDDDDEVVALQGVLEDIARNFYGVESDLLTKAELNIAKTLEDCGFLTYNPINEKMGEYTKGI